MTHDLVTALAMLPETYGIALRLRVGGASTKEIGDHLGLEPAAVEPLLSVADSKLRAILLADEPVSSS